VARSPAAIWNRRKPAWLLHFCAALRSGAHGSGGRQEALACAGKIGVVSQFGPRVVLWTGRPSSSRRQRDTRTASAKTTCTGWLLSAGIRQCPSKIRVVVTQFVTQTGDDHVRRPLQQGEHRYESITSDRANRPVVPTKPRAIGCSSPGCNPGRGSGGCPGRRPHPC
jgi:hypothetical protein